MSCCGKKRKQASKDAKVTLASPAGILMRRENAEKITKRAPVTPPVTER